MDRGLSLGAVVAGVIDATFAQFMLLLVGAAIGLTALPLASASEQTTQIGFGAWILGSLVASVFFGAFVAGAGGHGRGVLHGVVTWAAFGLLTLGLVVTRADAIVGGTLRIAGRTVAAAAPQVAPAATTKVEQAVAEVKEKVADLKAVDEAKQGIAIGLWSVCGVELLLLLVALLGGGLGGRPHFL
jgi:hypothetical protein